MTDPILRVRGPRAWPRRASFVALSFVLGLLGASIVAEVALRIHNPLALPLRGKRIVLPVNQTRVWSGPPANSKVDETIVFKSNEIGFRGPSPPVDFAGHLTILTVGGSTTECQRLTDGKDWPAVLARGLERRFEGVWLNNAGLDGHSTFGHAVLLEQVVLDLAPDYVVFLIGINDVGREGSNEYDLRLDPANGTRGDRFIARSEFLSTAQALARTWRARRLGLSHLWELDLRATPTVAFTPRRAADWIDKHRRLYTAPYGSRVEHLIRRCRERGIEPILITQPALFGDGVDPTTGVDIAPLKYAGRPAALGWTILELYNDVTRRVGREQGVLVVDLAVRLPRDSRYYYDWMHFTNAGAERVAAMVAEDMVPFLASRGAPAISSSGAGRRSSSRDRSTE